MEPSVYFVKLVSLPFSTYLAFLPLFSTLRKRPIKLISVRDLNVWYYHWFLQSFSFSFPDYTFVKNTHLMDTLHKKIKMERQSLNGIYSSIMLKCFLVVSFLRSHGFGSCQLFSLIARWPTLYSSGPRGDISKSPLLSKMMVVSLADSYFSWSYGEFSLISWFQKSSESRITYQVI